jgi:hypothetical protein
LRRANLRTKLGQLPVLAERDFFLVTPLLAGSHVFFAPEKHLNPTEVLVYMIKHPINILKRDGLVGYAHRPEGLPLQDFAKVTAG